MQDGDFWDGVTNTSNTVRPAIHFNLTKTEENSIRFITVEDVSNVYNGQTQTLDNVMPNWYDKTLYGTEDSSKVQVVYPTGDIGDKHAMIDVNSDGYEVSVTIKDTANYLWADDKGKAEPTFTRTFKYVITKKQINVSLTSAYPPVANIAQSEICTHDTDYHGGYKAVKEKLYFTYDSADGQKHYNTTLPTDPGDYIATVHIGECNYYIEEKTTPFKIAKPKPDFDPDTHLKWVYKNDGIENGKAQNMPEGNHLEYNGYKFTVSLADTWFNDLAAIGVTVADNGISGDCEKENSNAHPDEVAVYVIKVKIVALNEKYDFDDTEVTFNWYIDQATYVLSKYTPVWSYTTARGETGLYSKAISEYGGVQYEGGGTLGNITLTISGGLPTGLTANLTGNVQSAVNRYTVKVTSFTNTNKNYNDIKTLPSASDVEWIEWEWEIVPRTLSTADWSAAVYNNGEVTKAPELNTLPYNPSLGYKYYKTKGGEEIPLSELKYKDGIPETYYVEVFIQSSDSGNWKLGNEDNPHEFKVGQQKDAVVITITAGGTYDGKPKEAKIGLVGQYAEIDEDSFDIKYFKSDDTPLIGAPTDAGSYYAVVSLKTRFAEKYYLNCDDTLNFEIKTLELAIPSYSGTIVYDGEEHDVAKLVNLPDGWENYITISIESKTSGVDHPKGYTVKTAATYTVTYRIKAEVNENLAINSPKNVQWVGGTITSKSIEKLVVEKLILHAEEWEKIGYNSYLVFTEPGGKRFVEYTVTNSDGEIIVDEDGVIAGETYTVKVTVKDEHLGSVVIEYPKGVTDKYEFFKDDGTPPVQVALPTIGDLTFNGKSQTFTVDYGKFAEYIEIDEPLSDLLSQINAGKYTVYFKIKKGVIAVWADTGDRNAVPVTFEMKPLVLDDPKVKDGEKFTYNGTEQSATLNIDSAMGFMIIEGAYKATNAGKYTFKLSIDPSYEGNVVWKSATSDKSVDWTIEKAKITVKWTDGDIPELDVPDEFKDLDVEYEITDENGKKVTRDQMEAGGTYTITAKLSDGSSANYEFVDDSGKTLKNPTTTDGLGFKYKDGGSSFPWWIIALIAGVLLLLTVLIIVIVKRRQVADGDDEYDDFYDDEYDFDEEEIEEDFGDDF